MLKATGQGAAGDIGRLANVLFVITIIFLFLYLGREILQPLAIAALLGFVLTPLTKRLRSSGIPRIPAVLLSVLFAIAIIAALGSTIALQVSQLAQELPKYELNLRNKIRSLSSGSLSSGPLERAASTLKKLQGDIEKSPADASKSQGTVEVRSAEPTPIQSMVSIVQPLLSPLATTALTILFLMFILLQREDIRDRFLRLAGTSDLRRSTAALDDAAARLSRYFLMQTLLNAGFGAVIGLGLWIIGIPNAALWAILAGLMRYVPFIGTIIGAVFPIVIAAAVDPGWTMVISTAVLFIISEPIAGQVVEPVLYGQHTGLSPVAIIISTLFWALLWGPVGLLLATPLTVCLVVLGRHIEALKFIEVLLGDEPALEPEERFYQRLLAADTAEAVELAEQHLKDRSMLAFYDDVPMKALALAQSDAAQGKLPVEQQAAIRDSMAEVVDELADAPVADGADENNPVATVSQELTQERPEARPVLCIASRSPLDEAASAMLAHVLKKHGLTAIVQPFVDLRANSMSIKAHDAPLVCLSYFGAGDRPAPVRILIRRLRRVMPRAKFLAGYWLLGDDPQKVADWKTAVGADFVATSLSEAADICLREFGMAREAIITEAPKS